MNKETLYQAVIRLGIPHDHHESDLYLPYTEEVRQLLQTHGLTGQPFKHSTEGTIWIDVPFMYAPFWERKAQNQ